jgi:chaperone modulatory protein CbpM
VTARNKQDLLGSVGLDVQTLESWLEYEWLIPEESSAGPAFSDRDLARAHFIRDLRDDFGVNDEGIDLVLHLVDQLHGMRRVLAELRRGMEHDRLPPAGDGRG